MTKGNQDTFPIIVNLWTSDWELKNYIVEILEAANIGWATNVSLVCG